MAWLRCSLSPGMFSAERAAVFRDHRGGYVELFAPDDCVRGEFPRGELLVSVVDEREGLSLVQLPAESLQGSKFVTVKAGELAH